MSSIPRAVSSCRRCYNVHHGYAKLLNVELNSPKQQHFPSLLDRGDEDFKTELLLVQALASWTSIRDTSTRDAQGALEHFIETSKEDNSQASLRGLAETALIKCVKCTYLGYERPEIARMFEGLLQIE